MQEKKNKIKGVEKRNPLSHRTFWKLISRMTGRSFSFKYEYKKWFWKKSEKKKYILELYCMGYNQLEIAGILLMSPLKIRKVLKSLRSSLEWYIKINKLLED